jgi:hypothetical protein
MTFNTNVPDASQSPGLFPTQNNTNFTRLQAIIAGDHQFNNTAPSAPPNNDGVHKQVTLINRANPSSVPTGSNSMFYGKLATDTVNEIWFFDGGGYAQVNWREIFGTAVMNSSSFAKIATIPANVYGYIYMYSSSTSTGPIASAGTFVSNSSDVNGFAYAEKWLDGSGAAQVIRLGNKSLGASGLDLTGKNETGVSGLNTNWTYRIFYRLK